MLDLSHVISVDNQLTLFEIYYVKALNLGMAYGYQF